MGSRHSSVKDRDNRRLTVAERRANFLTSNCPEPSLSHVPGSLSSTASHKHVLISAAQPRRNRASIDEPNVNSRATEESSPNSANSQQNYPRKADKQCVQICSSVANTSDKLMSSFDKKVLQLVRERYPSIKSLKDRRKPSRTNTFQRCPNERIPSRKLMKRQVKFATHQSEHEFEQVNNQRRCGSSSDVGDVFIYPPNYRDMNECQKCERDNKICNCIDIEAPDDVEPLRLHATTNEANDIPEYIDQSCSSIPKEGKSISGEYTYEVNKTLHQTSTDVTNNIIQNEVATQKCEKVCMIRNRNSYHHTIDVESSGNGREKVSSSKGNLGRHKCGEINQVSKINSEKASISQHQRNLVKYPKVDTTANIEEHSWAGRVDSHLSSDRMIKERDDEFILSREVPATFRKFDSSCNFIYNDVTIVIESNTNVNRNQFGMLTDIERVVRSLSLQSHEDREIQIHADSLWNHRSAKLNSACSTDMQFDRQALPILAANCDIIDHDRSLPVAGALPIRAKSIQSLPVTLSGQLQINQTISPHLDCHGPTEPIMLTTNTSTVNCTLSNSISNLDDRVDRGNLYGWKHRMAFKPLEIGSSLDGPLIEERQVCEISSRLESIPNELAGDLTAERSKCSKSDIAELDHQKASTFDLNLNETIKVTSDSQGDNHMNSSLSDSSPSHNPGFELPVQKYQIVQDSIEKTRVCVENFTLNDNSMLQVGTRANPRSSLSLRLSYDENVLERNLGEDDDEKKGYSPILTGCRDYIENINTGIQLNSPQSPSVLVGPTMPMILPPVHAASALQAVTDLSSSQATMIATSVSSVTSTMPTILTTMTLSANVSAAPTTNVTLNDHLEPSKKSIFDGASKDEILTYLEDARGRVPELLIAADEVMMIGENELLLVNQLEPNSLATTISIEEAPEVINPIDTVQEQRRIMLRDQDRIAALIDSHQQDSISTIDSPSLDQRIKMFDDGIKSLSRNSSSKKHQHANTSDSIDSTTQLSSIDDRSLLIMSPDDMVMPKRDFCQFADETLDNNDGQLSGVIDCETQMMDQQSDSIHHMLLRPSASFISESSNKNRKAPILSDNQLCISERVTSLLRRSARRKSTSESTSQSESKRSCRMLSLKKNYSKTQDSISASSSSSTSSTPASSSTSRSNSSNHTNGNGSGASNFYTSPSLSCSSPFFGLNQTAVTSSENSTSAFMDSNSTQITCPYAQTTSTSTFSQLAGRYILQDSTITCNSGVNMNGEEVVDSSVHHIAERGDSGLDTESSSNTSSSQNGDIAQAMMQILADNSPPSDTQPVCEMQEPPQVISKQSNMDDLTACGTLANRLGVIEEHNMQLKMPEKSKFSLNTTSKPILSSLQGKDFSFSSGAPPGNNGTKTIGLNGSRQLHSHYATINRLNNYLINRHLSSSDDGTGMDRANEHSMVEFQCLDCDQFIITDQARVLHKANELRLLRESEIESLENRENQRQRMSIDQIDRAYVAALNGLPLCQNCEKKRSERKEIVSEFVDTELKYGRDLKIIRDEFYRPMRIAGLLNKDQMDSVFLNLDELIMIHCRFSARLESALAEAQVIGDTDYNTVNIGRIFVESADMLHTFESYCIRQGSAACLLARLAKEKELLRVFLRVSQMENALLRRMNLAAFLMVPVQRVTKYPLLLNRLYKVTAYHHKNREALRDAQLRVEMHLEHINQQTKGISATNKIWRRISNLSGPNITTSSNRRGLVSAEDIGYIKLRNTAMDLLKWDREETQFIHSGTLNLAFLNEYLVKQKMKSIRYISAHALLVVLGKPNWKYRPELVKSHLDNKLLVPTPGGNGIREAALLLFREKNGRFIPCREPLLLSNSVLSNDCSQFNSEVSHIACHQHQSQLGNKQHFNSSTNNSSSNINSSSVGHCSGLSSSSLSLINRRSSPATSGPIKRDLSTLNEFRAASAESSDAPQSSNLVAPYPEQTITSSFGTPASKTAHTKLYSSFREVDMSDQNSTQGDSISMSSLKSLPEEQTNNGLLGPALPQQTSRSYSLASALPRATTTNSNTIDLTKSASSSTASNLTILNPFKSKSSAYSHHASSTSGNKLHSSRSNSESVPIPTKAYQGHKIWSSASVSSSFEVAGALIPSEVNLGHRDSTGSITANSSTNAPATTLADEQNHHHCNHHFFHNHNQPYGDYEELFEIHDRVSKESLLLRADTTLKTRFWLQMLRYHAKDLGHWRQRRLGLANIMMMRQES